MSKTLKIHNPSDAMTPVGPYSMGVEVPAGARMLYLAGQVGTDKNGATGEGYIAQMRIIFENCRAILASAGMTPADVVKVNSYLVRALERTDAERAQAAQLWQEFFGAHRPASTLVHVDRLVGPQWLVEVEMVAARKD